MPLREFLERVASDAPTNPACTESVCLAGHDVRFEFSSAALAERLTRSVRHLRHTHDGPPALVISCWTSDDSNDFPWPAAWPRTGVVYLEDASLRLSWEPPDGPLVVYDQHTRIAWMRFTKLDNVTGWEHATPFRKVLHWWAADAGLQLVHAACVGNTKRGLLLVGKGGSGKSTTALACLDRELGYIGDDYCLVAPGERPMAHSLYLSAKGDARTASLLPGLRDTFLRSPVSVQNKFVIFADDVRPAAMLRACALAAIVIPRIVGGSTSRLARVPPIEALRALAPSTLFQLPGDRSETLQRLSVLVRQVDAWSLEVGDDPYGAVAVLDTLLNRHVDWE